MDIYEYRRLVIATIGCPACSALEKEPCISLDNAGRISYIHDDRSLAYEEIITLPPFVIDAEYIRRQRYFSKLTFGPGTRTDGIIDHITKELIEIKQEPNDLSEWADIIILGFDGAWRCGEYTAQEVLDAVNAKLTKNESRTWPDWRTAELGKAIEHDRSKD